MKLNINKKIITKEIKKNEKEIFLLINEAESLNQYYKDNLKSFDTNYLITSKDIKLFHFIFQYLFQSLKYKEIRLLFNIQNKKTISKQKTNINNKIHSKIEKIKYIIPKFINFCLINNNDFARYLDKSLEYFTENILKITKIFFLMIL